MRQLDKYLLQNVKYTLQAGLARQKPPGQTCRMNYNTRRDTMTMRSIAAGCIFILCFSAILAVPVMAVSSFAGNGNGLSTTLLDKLNQQGYDISEIRVALDNGDNETAENLMHEFIQDHPDVFPEHKGPAGNTTDTSSRMLELLDNLEQTGYDISEIRTAVQNGDNETVHTLMQQLREAHPEVFPEHKGSRGNTTDTSSRMPVLLDNPEQTGYDISTIRTAIQNGENETVHALMQQFQKPPREAFNDLGVPVRNTTDRAPPPQPVLPDRTGKEGYNVSAINPAVQTGDNRPVHNMMQQYQKANPDTVPASSGESGQKRSRDTKSSNTRFV
jgi:DNA-binding transcriptional MerR regulator